MMRLYKINIYNNRFFIFICFIMVTLNIILDSFIQCSINGESIYELQLVYSNLNLSRQWIYISICTIITLKILSFTDSFLYMVRLGTKDKIWRLIVHHILITNFIISLYLVTCSYISALILTRQNYMEFNKTLMLLIALILIYTVGLSMFSIIAFIIKIITGSKNIAYMVILVILVPEILKAEKSLILCDISFNMDYLKNTTLAFLNMLKFGGITILLFEVCRLIYKKEEMYNMKK